LLLLEEVARKDFMTTSLASCGYENCSTSLPLRDAIFNRFNIDHTSGKPHDSLAHWICRVSIIIEVKDLNIICPATRFQEG
jgi:hypothetical protein